MRHLARNARISRLAAVAACAALLFSSCAETPEAGGDLQTLPTKYVTDGAVAEAITLLSAEPPKATVLSDVKTLRKAVFLSFEGITDAHTTGRLLDLLDTYKVKSTFFLPGIKSAEDPDTAAAIASRGHQIGNYTLRAETHMEVFPAEELAENFARTNAILSDITGEPPTIFRCRATDYTEDVLRAAGAAGAEYVLDVRQNLSYQSLNSSDNALNYVLGLERGAVLSVHLDSVLNEDEYEREDEQSESQDAPPTVIADSEALVTNPSAQTASREDRLISVVEYLLAALVQEQFEILPISKVPEYEDPDLALNFYSLQTENAGTQSAVFTNARTTARGVAISFRSLQDEERLDKLLSALESEGIIATFYVTGREIDDYPERIERILAAGHTLENGGMSGEELSSSDFEQISLEIYVCGKMLNERYGIDSKLFMPYGGKITDTILEAANAQGYTVASYNKNPVGQGVADAEALAGYFSNGFNRGDIIYGDLERFDGWDEFIPFIADMVRGTGYGFETAARLFSSQYPVYDVTAIPGWNSIYINSNFNPEIPRVDDYVVDIKTNEKVMFLTFDDWGSDKTITGLLDTLYRYNAKASFFARANGVELNPNLARAIGEQGHDLVSHSYAHQPIVSISTQELQADAVKAHRILTQTLGKAPPLLYRPPTLDYNDSALNALFASGFKYIMSGDPSTHDYERTAQEVIDMVLELAQPGRIVVMHMSDNSCAREAISVIIPTLQAQGYHFARLSDYLK